MLYAIKLLYCMNSESCTCAQGVAQYGSDVLLCLGPRQKRGRHCCTPRSYQINVIIYTNQRLVVVSKVACYWGYCCRVLGWILQAVLCCAL